MKHVRLILAGAAFGLLLQGGMLLAQTEENSNANNSAMLAEDEKLVILWTSGDRDVALKMVFMYTYNAKKNDWWKDITLVVWGPSAKLLTEDKELQEYLQRIMDVGVEVRACKGCADQYGVSGKLEALGITVLYIGKEFTDYIQQGRNVLTI
jgi:hypothetical protein